MTVSITVVGSCNLDLVAKVDHLPVAGETVSGAVMSKHPGGKGANMALAARRLGADVRLVAAVGDDPEADQALALLRRDGVDLSSLRVMDDNATGIALIGVSKEGENQIIVAPGANHALSPAHVGKITTDATLCVLEVPVETVLAAAHATTGFFAVNLAPALPVPDELIERADLVIVNEGEAAVYGDALFASKGWVVVTLGAEGAVLYRDGAEVARAKPPKVDVIDTTGAGDTFSGAITVALTEGMNPQAALAFANAAGSLATTVLGAQPSIPTRADVEGLLS